MRVAVPGLAGTHSSQISDAVLSSDRAPAQITDTVYPMYKAYIEPDLNTAHLKIYNNFNPFSGFMAPTYILKSAKQVLPEQIKAVLKVCVSPDPPRVHSAGRTASKESLCTAQMQAADWL